MRRLYKDELSVVAACYKAALSVFDSRYALHCVAGNFIICTLSTQGCELFDSFCRSFSALQQQGRREDNMIRDQDDVDSSCKQDAIAKLESMVSIEDNI